MMRTGRIVSLVVLLFCSAAFAGSFGIFEVNSTFKGPCDIVTCAEAYSVSRAMTANYRGPLFQLYNGSATLDVGLNSAHQVDLSTWSEFCGGVQSNCVYGKIYAQIQVGQNDVIPSIFRSFGVPDCSGGTAYKCACPFSIDSSSGLPILDSTLATCLYAKAGDASGVGITGGNNNVSVGYVGRGVNSTFCCGQFGISHCYNCGDVEGTDFLLTVGFGNAGSFPPCHSSTTYCMGVDEELVFDTGDYGSSIINVAAFATYAAGSNTVTGAVNGHSLFSASPPNAGSLAPGTSIHFCAGGDLSGPAPCKMFEGFITNTTLSLGQQNSVLSNATAFYSALSFP